MKKYLFFAASALTLASCSSDDFLGDGQENGKDASTAINFSSNAAAVTRANPDHKESAAALGNNFVIVGFKGKGKTEANHKDYAFDHYNVNYVQGTAGSTESNTKDWEYVGQKMDVKGVTVENKSLAKNATLQTIKYWDRSCDTYDFIAFSMGNGTGDTDPKEYATPTAVQEDKLADEAYTLTGDVKKLSECYISNMKTVKKEDYSATKAVEMQFRHATSKVRMAIFETVPGYVINEVKFYSSTNNTKDNSTTVPCLTGTFNNNGTMTVYFPTTGTDKENDADHNKAHIKFKPATDATGTVKDLTFTGVNYNNVAEDALEETNKYLGQTRENASYCGQGDKNMDFVKVLPAEDNGDDITLKIDYTLTATDGTNEKINVYGATATVPAAYAKWKSGFAYTYIFKISKDTNGSTDPDNPDNPGLAAISFDAVVLNDEENGNQETITTVSDPSITTYGFKDGKVTVNGNEYDAQTNIYATAFVPATTGEDAKKSTTAAPQKLYTVTIEAGAAQKINESSVANAIAKGTKDSDNKTITVIDANNKKMILTEATFENVSSVPTEDGRNLDVYAIKWTGAANTIYAVEYKDATSNKAAYKIVNVK